MKSKTSLIGFSILTIFILFLSGCGGQGTGEAGSGKEAEASAASSSDSCSTMECFNEYFKTCEPATFSSPNSDESYEIFGKMMGLCVVKATVSKDVASYKDKPIHRTCWYVIGSNFRTAEYNNLACDVSFGEGEDEVVLCGDDECFAKNIYSCTPTEWIIAEGIDSGTGTIYGIEKGHCKFQIAINESVLSEMDGKEMTCKIPETDLLSFDYDGFFDDADALESQCEGGLLEVFLESG